MRILSLGAGVQSSTLALMIEHGEVPMVDCAIFADTGDEPQEVYEWLEYLKSKVSYPVLIVKKGHLKQDSLDNSFIKLPIFTKNLDTGKIGFARRQCTNEYKIQPINKKVRELLGLKKYQRVPKDTKIQMIIGISKDEMVRCKDNRLWWMENHYPLVFEKNFTRQDCLQWMKEKNYPEPSRSACVYCPFNSNKEWLNMKINRKNYWKECVEFDKNIRNRLKNKKFEAYLHRSCVPLDQVVFNIKEDTMDMFNDICDEGMCGV